MAQTDPMNNQPPLIFSLLGVIVGVGVAWLLTRESVMALIFLAVGLITVIGWRVIQNRR